MTVSGAETPSPRAQPPRAQPRVESQGQDLTMLPFKDFFFLLYFAASGSSYSTRDLSLWHLGSVAPQHAPE